MKPYSHDIRIRVLNAYQQGEESQRKIAKRFNVSLTFVRDLLKRYRETGSTAPKKYVGRSNSKIDKDSLQVILALVADDPLLPLSSLCERLAQERHLRISRATMWRTLQKHRAIKAMLSSALHEHTDLPGLPHTPHSAPTAIPLPDSRR